MEAPLYFKMSPILEAGFTYLQPLLPTTLEWFSNTMKLLKPLTTVMSCSLVASNIVPYSEYILAPASRTIFPTSVYKVNGTVTRAESLVGGNGSAAFQGVSSVTYGELHPAIILF